MNETLEIKVNEIESMIAANAEKIKEALKMGKKMFIMILDSKMAVGGSTSVKSTFH